MRFVRCLCRCHDTDEQVQYDGVSVSNQLEAVIACPLCIDEHEAPPTYHHMPPALPPMIPPALLDLLAQEPPGEDDEDDYEQDWEC